MAVAPERLAPGGGARGVHDTRLHHDAVRLLGVPASRHIGLASCDLGEGAAEMYGDGAPAGLRGPRDRSVKGPVDLADARPVAETPESVPVAGGEPVTGEADQPSRRDVEQ